MVLIITLRLSRFLALRNIDIAASSAPAAAKIICGGVINGSGIPGKGGSAGGWLIFRLSVLPEDELDVVTKV